MNVTPVSGTIDPLNPFNPSFTGLYCDTVKVSGKIRKYYSFIPKNVRSSTAGVLVFPPNGVSALEMARKSNWCDLAETDERKEKFIVLFLEPLDDTWNTEIPYEELEYVKAVFESSRGRDKYCIHEAKYYMVGYREGGTIAQLAAMYDPAVYAGVVSVEAKDVAEKLVEEIGEDACLRLNGYTDDEKKYGYRKKNFMVPSWVISSNTVEVTAESTICRYWRKAACSEEQPHQLRPDVIEYYRSVPAPWTVNQEKEAFRVWVSEISDADADLGAKMNRRIWSEFLRGVRRWMAEPGGDLRVTKDPVADLGMEYHYECIDGWMREYYVYIPTYMRSGFLGKVPLVIACHGYTCSGEIYAGNSEWYKVAEDKGFIVIFPSAAHGILRSNNPDNPAVGPSDTALPAWNIFDYDIPRPQEIPFFEEIINRICGRYPIDRSRVYVTGHSLGSIMTQYLGMAKPELFAAIAPCSGVLFLSAATVFPEKPEIQNRKQVRLPVWMFGGENEKWLLQAVPSLDNDTGTSIHTWWDMNEMPGDKPTDFEAYRTDSGRWKDYEFSDSGVPMIRYTWIEEMPHATMTEMSYRIWNEFFSKFSRNEDGSIAYDV